MKLGRPIIHDHYGQSYSNARFWSKLTHSARVAGRHVVRLALILYYTLEAKETPAWAKSAVVGALGYLIAVVDAFPDFVPTAGYVDDLVVLSAALAAVSAHVTPEIRKKAKEKAREWVPN